MPKYTAMLFVYLLKVAWLVDFYPKFLSFLLKATVIQWNKTNSHHRIVSQALALETTDDMTQNKNHFAVCISCHAIIIHKIHLFKK
jgi:hypothetical protein